MKMLNTNSVNDLLLKFIYDPIKDSSRKPELNFVRPIIWRLVFNSVYTLNENSIWNFLYYSVSNFLIPTKEKTHENA